jgi:hypothetical protein
LHTASRDIHLSAWDDLFNVDISIVHAALGIFKGRASKLTGAAAAVGDEAKRKDYRRCSMWG